MGKDKLFSPLRYPGGKGKMTSFFKNVLQVNGLNDCHYYELYAGGAAVGLDLLLSKSVNRITLNDGDYHIYAFWNAILNYTEEFLRKLHNCTVSINSWKRQRNVYLNPSEFDILEVGFSTFFLNRCNRSGILTKAGPIGGMLQNGNYLIDARFNKKALENRILSIAAVANNIQVYNLDSLVFLDNFEQNLFQENCFFYLDPPYYKKGRTLYLNHYQHDDHVNIASKLNTMRNCNWIVTYDNVPEIENIYASFNKTTFNLNYSLQKTRIASEIMILSDNVTIPNPVNTYMYNNYLNVII